MTTELERLLKDSLLKLEKEISATQTTQGENLEAQKTTLADQDQEFVRLWQEIDLINDDLQVLARQSQDLAELYNHLEPLLTKLDGVLNDKR